MSKLRLIEEIIKHVVTGSLDEEYINIEIATFSNTRRVIFEKTDGCQFHLENISCRHCDIVSNMKSSRHVSGNYTTYLLVMSVKILLNGFGHSLGKCSLMRKQSYLRFMRVFGIR